jgi:PAS domain S-box-containing protein/putative nucleotidyltransferase with HDIG domain
MPKTQNKTQTATRRAAYKEIAAFLKGYKHVAELSNEAMFMHNTDGDIFDVNRSAEMLTGYTKEELLGMNIRRLLADTDEKVSEKILNLIKSLEVEVDFESQFRKKNGEMINVRIIGDKFKFKKDFFIIDLVRIIATGAKFDRKKTMIGAIQDKKFLRFLSPLDKIYSEPMRVLIEVAESRDPYTMQHSVKVAARASELAVALGLSKEEIETIKLAAMFHDIGKIGIRAQVLTKKGPLTDKEYEEVKKHPLLSVEIIKSIKPLVKRLVPIIRHHHENYNGTGYPDGVKGAKIPIGSRVLSIADVYDALTSERAYRKAYSYREALRIMKEDSAKKFDPGILERFLECLFQQRQKKFK